MKAASRARGARRDFGRTQHPADFTDDGLLHHRARQPLGPTQLDSRAFPDHVHRGLVAVALALLLGVVGRHGGSRLGEYQPAQERRLRRPRHRLAGDAVIGDDRVRLACKFRHARFGVNLNSNSKAPDGLHRALLSQVTSRLLGSEDFEIMDVCHHTVVPST